MSSERSYPFRIVVENEHSLIVQYKGTPKRVDIEIDVTTRKTIDVLSRWFADGRIKERDEIEVLGGYLFKFLFQGKARTEFKSALQDHRNSKTRLRLLLEFQYGARDLASWPWEYLYVPDDQNSGQKGIHLASDTKLTLARHVPDDVELGTLTEDGEELRILVVVAAARDQNKVKTDDVLQELTEIKENSKEKIKLTILPGICPDCQGTGQVNGRPCPRCGGTGQLQATHSQFFQETKQRPHIVHFIGHGRFENSIGSLGFIDDDDHDRTEWISDAAVAGCFSGWTPRLVFLQACEGAKSDRTDALSGVASNLAYSGIPAVIAMRFKVTNLVAERFAKKFYEVIREGSISIDEAVQRGREEVLNRLIPEGSTLFGCPVVYMHNFVDAPEYRYLKFPTAERDPYASTDRFHASDGITSIPPNAFYGSYSVTLSSTNWGNASNASPGTPKPAERPNIESTAPRPISANQGQGDSFSDAERSMMPKGEIKGRSDGEIPGLPKSEIPGLPRGEVEYTQKRGAVAWRRQ
ncbi:MAG: CHAT domain-containing protein [Pseudomonadota bacterium]